MTITLANTATAQMQEWVWDEYSTKFSVPNDFTVKFNDASKFEAGNGNIVLTIYPKRGEALSYGDMINSVNNWANSNSVVNQTNAEYVDDLNGYWGVAIGGTASNYPVFLMLAIDPDYTDISLYIWISYNEAYESIAEQILLSFTPN